MTRTQKLVGAGVAAVLALAVAVFLYLQDDSPPAPNIDDAAAAAGADDDAGEDAEQAAGDETTDDAEATGEDPADGDDASAEPTESADEDTGSEDAAAEDTGSEDAVAEGDVAGTWTIDAGSSDAIDDGTFVGYRVEEELASVGQTTAFGRSPAVSGEVVLTESTVESIDVTADLTQLQSDSSRRDGALRTRGLETDQFPEASFTSSAPVDLPDDATSGEAFTVEVPGELTLHGVTNEVTVPLEAQLVGGRIAVVSSFLITMGDHDITPPQVGPVLSIADEGTMELQLFLSRD